MTIRKQKSTTHKVGGADSTFCMCPMSSTSCYGDVECDCSNPKAARCVKTGISTEDEGKNKKLMKNEIKEILDRHRRKKNNQNNINNVNKTLPLKDRYVTEIKEGLKIIDIKPLNRTTENIKVGDVVIFRGDTKNVKTKIIDITCHKDLHSALKTATLKRVLPRSSKTYKQGINELKKSFGPYNNKHNNKKYINLNFILLNPHVNH